MPVLAWVGLGVAVWLVLGMAVAVVVGRMARQRDRQVPHDLPTDVAGNVPDPRDGTDDASLQRSSGHRSNGGAPPA